MKRFLWLSLALILFAGFVLPQNFSMPVIGATKSDYNKDSFWYCPWGKSGTHKGVDIFAKEGTPVHPSTKGLVIYSGNIKLGGNVILILGPKWRFHYYAHLKESTVGSFEFVNSGKIIGTVGTTGNAAGKQPHLHYSIVTPFPYFWRIDSSRQGWKKMFYLNPITYLREM